MRLKSFFASRKNTMLLVLFTAGVFVFYFGKYTNSEIEKYQDQQETILQKYYRGEFSDDETKEFVVEIDYFAKAQQGISIKSGNGRKLNYEEQKVENVLNDLFETEREYIDERYGSGIALIFIIISGCTIVADILIRIIFRKVIRKR